ncbi:peroxidase-like [Daktulosphaira vitifoliae]|uniref:peroxidase-like n=1 Tax=Daktulosphaira vitifoliae TaxID=58002 RepID=UPI0021AA5578|nr:peroxidase-like [Daktulosphaira vitifoliae]XP_050520445.1 peroxidase-like [Daktulosphaira vitifoliae]XP_050520446.1 peroxidase-like [Daktulosphaira vitifoliae]XP_050520447.1 peroxidase-like [Daktulosphaira vitifoliae]XP_050520448.1 peroxidase-like [Daktulosphaira vitifoliae]XP_050520449.1 peroxidase-like [Daktulosphaira vitifoliae]
MMSSGSGDTFYKRLRYALHLIIHTNMVKMRNQKCFIIFMLTLVSKGNAWRSKNDDCALPLKHFKYISQFHGEKCITYTNVTDAFHEACKGVLSIEPGTNDLTDIQLENFGYVLQETTRIICEWFGLTKDQVRSLLPLINTMNTDIKSFCPKELKSYPGNDCSGINFRSIDGRCNNIVHPHWGAAKLPFKRLLPPDYGDGIKSFRTSITGFPLPNPRSISARIHRDLPKPHRTDISFMFAAWGQLIDHDLTLTAETKEPITRQEIKCCSGATHPSCIPIHVPSDDQFFIGNHRQRCIDMIRSLAGVTIDCTLGPRVQINALTSSIDANFIYGSNDDLAKKLRSFEGGKLTMVPILAGLKLKFILPPKKHQPDDGCIRPHSDLYCFLAGDNRVNEQLALGVLHTIFAREHNRIADELCVINPHWDDERLYQETRKIIGAMVQHITYNEFLPKLLGKYTMKKFGLELVPQGFSNSYDPDIDITIPAVFGSAAFRFGHSLLPDAMERWSVDHKFLGSRRFSEIFQQPYDLHKPGWLDQYLLGMVNQPSQAMDDAITSQVTNHLFQEPVNDYGKDLASINIQRGREHGIPSYSAWRQFCKLQSIKTWSSMLTDISNATVKAYHDLFTSSEDVDLWSAGVSERAFDGSIIGPTLSCIIAKTFSDLKKGDRFWYENPDLPNSFTLEQLSEIKKIKLSRVLCDNSDGIATIQPFVLELPSYNKNSRVSCKGHILPQIDLWAWKEYPGCCNKKKVSNPHNPTTQSHKVHVNERNKDDENLYKFIQAIAVNISSAKPYSSK